MQLKFKLHFSFIFSHSRFIFSFYFISFDNIIFSYVSIVSIREVDIDYLIEFYFYRYIISAWTCNRMFSSFIFFYIGPLNAVWVYYVQVCLVMSFQSFQISYKFGKWLTSIVLWDSQWCVFELLALTFHTNIRVGTWTYVIVWVVALQIVSISHYHSPHKL